MMKKLLVFVLAVVLCLGLCACDVEAVLDGVRGILDGNDGSSNRTENAVDQMVPAGDGDVSGGAVTWMPGDGEGNTYIIVDENGDYASGNAEYEVEIIDGVIYINGEAAGEVEAEGDGAYSYVVIGGDSEEE